MLGPQECTERILLIKLPSYLKNINPSFHSGTPYLHKTRALISFKGALPFCRGKDMDQIPQHPVG